jgi:branched-chain amino acid transport system ATP-binding protein
MLDIKDLVGGYGSVQILNGASLRVERARSSRCWRQRHRQVDAAEATSGLLKPWSGSIAFDGERIDGLRPDRDRAARTGAGHARQGSVPGMTVEEKPRLGAYVVPTAHKTAHALERVVLYFPILKEKRNHFPERCPAGSCRWSASGAA